MSDVERTLTTTGRSQERDRLAEADMLIVGGDDAITRAFLSVLSARGHRCVAAANFDEARGAVARNRFDLLIIDAAVLAANGEALHATMRRISPSVKTVVYSPAGTFASAVHAMRCGAVDFMALPMDAQELATRVEAALSRSLIERQRDERLLRLKKICRELNTARHEISDQVDVLCRDLVCAYQDISEQMNDVATATEFRTLLKQELDVEDLLRTALEYLLTKTGPTNAAVFLPDNDGRYNLGAYVNYDCPRESIATLLDHLCQAICPQMARETEIVSFDDAADFAEWIGLDDAGFLARCEVLAFSCRTAKDCLAVVVLFRGKTQPFDDKLAHVIDTLRAIFAEQLGNVIRVHQRALSHWPKDAHDRDGDGRNDEDDDDFGLDFGGMAA